MEGRIKYRKESKWTHSVNRLVKV